MDVVKREGGCVEFVFVHSRTYQEAQRTFMQAVKSNNHQKLIVGRLVLRVGCESGGMDGWMGSGERMGGW